MEKERKKDPPRDQTTPEASFGLFLVVVSRTTLSLMCIIWITTCVGNKTYIIFKKKKKKEETLN